MITNTRDFEQEIKDLIGNIQNSILDKHEHGLIAALMNMLQLHRELVVTTHQKKQLVTEAKLALDHELLILQNLNYRKLHLSREIASCEAYESIYQDIPLISLEEFNERSGIDVIMSPHQLMIKRLEYELKERERLEAMNSELKAKKSALVKSNNEILAELLTLDEELEKIIAASRGLQVKLNMIDKEEDTIEEGEAI